jgi:hypothetical protein
MNGYRNAGGYRGGYRVGYPMNMMMVVCCGERIYNVTAKTRELQKSIKTPLSGIIKINSLQRK